MRILYIHQYFRTPQEGGGIRSYYLAKGLVEAGHEVLMLCAHDGKKLLTEQIEGFKVIYLPVAYDNSYGFLKRITAFFGFVYQSIQFLKNHQLDYDLAYVSSTPLTTGLIALWLKKFRRLHYIFEVRDLWPEAPIQVGAIKNPLNKWMLYRLEEFIYQHADKIVALSPGMRNYIESKIKNKPVHLISNISDCAFFQPMDKSEVSPEIKSKYGITNEFVISYFGAAGKVNKLEFLLNKAALLKGKNIKFLIMAAGSELYKLKKICSDKALHHVQFFEFGSKFRLREMLQITDAVYISFDDLKVLETNSPNKFFDAIAAGKLIIVNNKGWVKEMIEKERCGFYADPHFPEHFYDKIRYFVENPSLLKKYQANARHLAESFFEKEMQINKMLHLIDRDYELKNKSRIGFSA